MKDPQYRTFTGIVYPDSSDYDFEIRLIQLGMAFEDFAYCLHDQDVHQTDDPKGEYTAGSPVKPHIHWIGRNQNARTINGIAKAAEVPAEVIRYSRKGWKKEVRYLIHADDKDKAQYSVGAVVANFDLDPYFSAAPTDQESAQAIFDYIMRNHCTSVRELTQWCFENGHWAAFRRSPSIWGNIMHEMISEDNELRAKSSRLRR